MTDATPLDFGGRAIGTTSSPVGLVIPRVVHLSDLPDDFEIAVPPAMRGFPPPIALGATTYPPQLIAMFGDVTASFGLVTIELDSGLDFVVDPGDALTTVGAQGTATVAFRPVTVGPHVDTVHGTVANLS